MDKKHLIVVLFALFFTVAVVVGLKIPVFDLASLFGTDSGQAQQSCNSQIYTINQPSGYSFSKECVQNNGVIYSDDSRFSFFNVAGGVLPSGYSYVRTPNISAKNDSNLNWSVTLQSDSVVYLYFRRRIAPTSVPSWVENEFVSNTSATPVDVQSLNHYLLRKSTITSKVGVYDTYFVRRSAGSTINFGPANNALSMYVVVVVPDNESVRTPGPVLECPTGVDCNNDGPVSTPVATTIVGTPRVTPVQTPRLSPDPTVGTNPTPAQGSRETAVYLQTQSNSGQSGYAVITEMSSNQTRVSISLFGGNYSNQPAHIHSGSCSNPGNVIYPLNNVNGTSITFLNVPYTTVVNSLGVVNIHKSVAESNVHTACGVRP